MKMTIIMTKILANK